MRYRLRCGGNASGWRVVLGVDRAALPYIKEEGLEDAPDAQVRVGDLVVRDNAQLAAFA